MDKNHSLDAALDAYSVTARPLLNLKPPARRLGELALYTAAAGSALALAPAAEASIIYSGIRNITVQRVTNGTAATPVDLNGDGTDDMALVIESTAVIGSTAAVLSGYDGVGFAKYGIFQPANFNASGANIDYNQNFLGFGYLRLHTVGSSTYGFFDPGPGATTTGFAGFGFFPYGTGTAQFGWLQLRLEVGSDGRTDNLTLIDWAFESVPGASIHVGDRSTTSIPEPSTLGLLALGAAGLAALRRRRGHEKKADRVHSS